MFPTPKSESADPDVLSYVRQKRLDLAIEIRDRKKVYLDTKYWVLLRDVRLNRSQDPNVVELLRRLEAAVKSGTLICPFNAEIFVEVLKQNDEQTLQATAQLVDDLSLGVSILPQSERFELEIFHFIKSTRTSPSLIYELDDLVWAKTPYILGFLTPDLKMLPKDHNIEIQKSFCDYLWTLNLVDMLSTVGFDNVSKANMPSLDGSENLNKGKFAHLDEHASFRQIFLSEIAGILDFQSSMFSAFIDHLYERETRCLATEAENYNPNAGKELAQLLFQAFKRGKIEDQLPSTQILAGLHAVVRWNRDQRYKSHDLMDFGHAMAALPYCDAFLTDGPLCDYIHNGNLKFHEKFKCTTVAKPSDALALI